VKKKYKGRTDIYIKMKVEPEPDDYLDELKGYDKLKDSGVIPKLYEHHMQIYKIYNTTSKTEEQVNTLYAYYLVLEHCGQSIRDLYPISVIAKNGTLTLWPIALYIHDFMPDQNKFQRLLDGIKEKLKETYGVKQREHCTDNYCYSPTTGQLRVIDLEWIG
jgi:hypothetical protein